MKEEEEKKKKRRRICCARLFVFYSTPFLLCVCWLWAAPCRPRKVAAWFHGINYAAVAGGHKVIRALKKRKKTFKTENSNKNEKKSNTTRLLRRSVSITSAKLTETAETNSLIFPSFLSFLLLIMENAFCYCYCYTHAIELQVSRPADRRPRPFIISVNNFWKHDAADAEDARLESSLSSFVMAVLVLTRWLHAASLIRPWRSSQSSYCWWGAIVQYYY